jgi:dihydroorotase-like cyclic amidohydrolase
MPVDTTHSGEPFTPSDGHPVLFKHATVWDGVGGKVEDTDVAVAFGLIVKIGKGLNANDVLLAAKGYPDAAGFTLKESDVEIVDVKGNVLSPGLVDQHR